MKKGKGKQKKQCSFYKSETNVYENPPFAMKCVLALCVGQSWEMYHTKRLEWISVYISHILPMIGADIFC